MRTVTEYLSRSLGETRIISLGADRMVSPQEHDQHSLHVYLSIALGSLVSLYRIIYESTLQRLRNYYVA